MSFREPLKPALKLVGTLKHVATASNYADLMYSFRVSKNSISLYVLEDCKAIISVFEEEVMPDNISEEDWLRISIEFERI